MKNTVLILLLCLVSLVGLSQNVSIPDVNFKNCLLNDLTINTNGDGEIQLSEATSFTGSIECVNMGIFDLEGIEAFVNVTGLNAKNNNLSTLNLSQNIALEVLSVQTNQISSITLNTSNSLLWFIDIGVNQIVSFNAMDHPLLKILVMHYNQLTSLDVSQNPLLESLRCDHNQLSTLDLSHNPLLYSLLCNHNLLTSLDVTQNPLLFNLICNDNQISSLDLTQSSLLENVNCSYNQLTSLDVSQNTVLEELICHKNSISGLDLIQNTALVELQCAFNMISSLDLVENIHLTSLNCSSNQLSFLNVRNGNNTNFTVYNSLYNPQLFCIIVDDAIYSATNWSFVDTSAVFVETLGGCNSLSTTNHLLNDPVAIYPNPSSNYIHIDYQGEINDIEVYDASGQKVLDTEDRTINIKHLESGIYFLKLDFDKGTTTKKIVVY